LSDPAAGISTLNGMSVEGSTPLSHNSIEDNEKAAVAISDVNDSFRINLSFTIVKRYKLNLFHKTINTKARFVNDLCNIRVDRSKSLQLAFFYF
jgi:hypothetical protein